MSCTKTFRPIFELVYHRKTIGKFVIQGFQCTLWSEKYGKAHLISSVSEIYEFLANMDHKW